MILGLLITFQASVPENVLPQVQAAIEFLQSSGFAVTAPSSLGQLSIVSERPGWRVFRIGSDGTGSVTFAFDSTWRLTEIDNSAFGRSKPGGTPLSAGQKVELCRTFLRRVGWSSSSEVLSSRNTGSAGQPVFNFEVRHGVLTEFSAASFSYSGDALVRVWIPRRLQNLNVHLSKPRLGIEMLVASALAHYQNWRPMPHSSIRLSPLYIGLPVASAGHPDPPRSLQVQEDYRHERPFPFWVVCLESPGSELRVGHYLYIDARTGELVSYVAQSGLGSFAVKSTTATPLDLSSIRIGKVTGRLASTQTTQEGQPKGPTCLVRSGKSVFLAPLDSEGRLWLKIGNRPWRAFRPDPKLLKAARASALLRRPSERTR